jgi:hypothetical protein
MVHNGEFDVPQYEILDWSLKLDFKIVAVA